MLQLTTKQFMDSLGTVFERYLNQDSGNKCYSLQTDTGPVWIKILNLESTPLDNLHEIISFYNSCESRLIPKNWELIELADGAVMQHDWVPGRVLRSPDEDQNDPKSVYSQFMALPAQKRITVFEKILNFFVELEEKSLIIEDFYDGCIIYDFEKDDVYLCDLDHFHQGPYELLKDRQYGSKRFMAPEEFQKGAVIDRKTAVYTLGATGFNLLNKNKRLQHEWPLSQERYAVLKKAVSASKANRYGSVADLRGAWVGGASEKPI